MRLAHEGVVRLEWNEIRVAAEEPCVDAIAGLFHIWGAGGVVIDNPATVRDYISQKTWDAHSFSEEYLTRDYVLVKAYFPAMHPILQEDLDRLLAIGGASCRIEVVPVREEDWADSWKAFYHTSRIGEHLVIKPSWEEYAPVPGEIVIELDPGMAFGTGTHFTTRACLELLESALNPGEAVLDIGTGSGILAIAAARLGAAKIDAFDYDELAVRIAAENVAMNGVEGQVNIFQADINHYETEPVPLVVANLTGDVIYRYIDRIVGHISAGGAFIGAGINLTQWELIEPSLRERGFTIEKTLFEEDWVAVLARR